MADETQDAGSAQGTAGDPLRPELETLVNDLPEQWGWLLALGIAMTVLGVIGVGLAFYLTLASVFIFGAFALAAAMMQIAHSFQTRDSAWQGRAHHFVVALIYIAIAGLIFWDPVAASLALTLWLGVAFGVIGTLRIVNALRYHRDSHWMLPLVMGIVDWLVAAVIFLGWPATGLWIIGLFVAVELIMNGWLLVFTALAVRRMHPTPEWPAHHGLSH